MLSQLFLGLSLVGAEWVLYFLIILSVISVAIIVERYFVLKSYSSGLIEADLAKILYGVGQSDNISESLNEAAQANVLQTKVKLEKNLAMLATIGSNAPFIGLFGTVLGIIKAFHDLSNQAQSGGAQLVSAGISEALVATAVGLLVAIPAVVAFNLYSKKIKNILSLAESFKCSTVSKILEGKR